MIPRAREALNDLAGRLGSRVIPELTDPFAQADTGLISLLMSLLGEELENGVANRLADGEALKTLFAGAPAEAPGAEGRAAFCTSTPSALTLTGVTAWLDQGLKLLIELHAWAEEADDALNNRIWSFLADHTERHKFDF
jgi:hypothetical protein